MFCPNQLQPVHPQMKSNPYYNVYKNHDIITYALHRNNIEEAE